MFARQAMPASDAQEHDISTVPTTPGGNVTPHSASGSVSLMGLSPQVYSSSGPTAMQVVGECPGDKRKRPQVDEQEDTPASKPPPPMSADKEAAQHEAAPRFASHDSLRKHLLAQSHREAQLRKARALQLPRASPYSH